jgi:AraC-like DNA-binding protein
MGDFLFIGSFFCSLITAYLLFFYKREIITYSDKILAILFLAYAYCTAGYLLLQSKWLIYVPHFYKTAQPVNYLVPPLAYLYVRAVLNYEKSFKKKDLIHLVPFLFIAINYLPLYITSTEEKLKLIKLVLNKIQNNYKIQDGFFPENIQFLRPIQSIIYIIFQWKLLFEFKKNSNLLPYKEHTIIILSWLNKFTIFITLTVVAFIFLVSGVIYGLNNSEIFDKLFFYTSIPVALSLFYLCSYLILNPNITLGLPYLDELKKLKTPKTINIINYSKEASLIYDYFMNNKLYLKQNLSIIEVSIALNIPLKLLSFIINQHFKVNFNDFVNQFRINEVIKRIENGDLQYYTINALYEDAGFTNKSTFLNAFKKIHKCTPSQYLHSRGIS